MFKLVKKIALAITFVLVYFFGIREARGIIHDFHLGTVLPEEYGVFSQDFLFTSPTSVSFSFYRETDIVHKIWIYKIPFGLFFLIAVISLILLQSDKKFFSYLVFVQIFLGFLSFIGLFLAKYVSITLLSIPDLLSRYLIPLCSLGLVALAYMEQKNKISEHD